MQHLSTKTPYFSRHSPVDSHSNRSWSQDNCHDYKKNNPSRKNKFYSSSVRGSSRKAYSGTIYPNGEFTIGYVGFQRKSIIDSRYERGIVGDIHGVSPEADFVEERKTKIPIPHEERTFSTLALSTPRNHHKIKRAYGKNGITSYGKRIVRNGCDYIQSKYHRNNVAFVTLTIPELPKCILKPLTLLWGRIVRSYFQELGRIHKNACREFVYTAVTEVQTQRWKNTGNPGWHIHYCCPIYKNSHKKGDYLVTADCIRSLWRRMLQNAVDDIPLDGVDFQVPVPRVDIQRIKSSTSAYMSKYMSKGTQVIAEIVEDLGEEFIPRQWWSMSAPLKRWISANRRSLSSSEIDLLFQEKTLPESRVMLYSNSMYICNETRGDICVAIVGKLTHEAMAAIGMDLFDRLVLD